MVTYQEAIKKARNFKRTARKYAEMVKRDGNDFAAEYIAESSTLAAKHWYGVARQIAHGTQYAHKEVRI